MKADRSDGPSRVQRKAGNVVTWGVSLLVGLGITAGGLYLAAGQMKPNQRAEAQTAKLDTEAKRKHDEQLRARQLANRQTVDDERNWIRPDEQAQRELQEWSRQRAQETYERQTSFNDDSYTPKQPVNTYKPAPIPAQQVASVERPRQQRSVHRERTSRWIKSWNGGTNYLAEWISVNNHIDGTTVCANHKRGSIDYRECRKAAKQHYHEECRTWRARYDNDRKDRSDSLRERYCVAASSFSPMG